ncbi:MAG TPA: cupin domain-containing protein [Isosphaeraceae bacterium]|jgi:mannose-6-phosphate isomerase-like protein (cupin superfamily)|nr:cupin domain-containing protein [Isosphaeraceae bacterium]
MDNERDGRDRGHDGGGLGLWTMLLLAVVVLAAGLTARVYYARQAQRRAAAETALARAETALRRAELQRVALRTKVPAPKAADAVGSKTVTLDGVEMKDFRYQNETVGKVGLYVSGDTPASTKFVTGRFVLEPGKTPHAPHVHPEEEVMIVESGKGEIFCDGKTTKVGPGSVMYTTPNAPHGITNTGDTPLVFYFVKWEAKGDKK